MNQLRLMIGLALVCLWLGGTAHGQSKYKIMVRGASLESKKRTGQDWDALGNKPDVYCVVSINGNIVFVSGKAKDTLTPRWWTGTEYWNIKSTSTVEIKLIDSDAGKLISRAGVAGVALQPDLPNIGKRIINDQLLKTDTDDVIAHWKGSFQSLLNAVGSFDTDVKIRPDNGDKSWYVNLGLRSLGLRIIKKASTHRVEARKGSTLASGVMVKMVSLEETKKGEKMKWDVGIGKLRNPDLQYMIYVNGSPVVLGNKNQDSYVGMWNSVPPPLNLSDKDLITISVTDADAGTLAAQGGSVGVMFSNTLTYKAKQQLFEELSKASTDDQVFVWEGEWGKLRRLGSKIGLQQLKQAGSVISDNGIRDISVSTGSGGKSEPAGRPLVLALGKVSIASKKANGKGWDFGRGKPDPFAKIFVSTGKSGWQPIADTKKLDDVYSGNFSWNSGTKKFKNPNSVKIELYDSDVASDDLINTFIVPIPKTPSKKTLTSKTVLQLEVEFR